MIKFIRNTEYGNMVKGIFILLVNLGLVVVSMYPTAYLTGAGDTARFYSQLFVGAQLAVIMACYIHWYLKVNLLARDLFNNSEMRKVASSHALRHLFVSIGITLLFAAIAFLTTIILIFGGIQIYAFIIALSECLIGNLTLGLLLWHFGLPNRVLGRY